MITDDLLFAATNQGTLDFTVLQVEHCRDELEDSVYVQKEEEMLATFNRFTVINQMLVSILDALADLRVAKTIGRL